MKYKVGDVLLRDDGKKKVLAVCGVLTALSSSYLGDELDGCYLVLDGWYTEDEIRDIGYRLPSPTVKVEMDNETYEKVKNGYGNKVKEIS